MPMANRAALQAVDSLFQALTGSTEPFGGKTFIGVGDFRQVAPVVRGGGLAAVVDASIRTSPVWDNFHISRLITPMRNAANPEFCLYVDSIGEDVERCRNIVLQHLPTIPDVQQALTWLYLASILQQPHLCIHRAFLSTLNARVDEFNQMVLDQLPGEKGIVAPPFNCSICLLLPLKSIELTSI
jgi:PIF1-like helicase